MSGAAVLWWRRSRFSVIVFVVLLAVATVVSLVIDVPGYLSSHPTQPRDVAAGTTTHYAGLDLRLDGRRVVRADSAEGRTLEVPAGTALVIVTLRIDPTAAPKNSSLCTVALVESTPAGLREWEIGFSSVGRYQTPQKDTSVCTVSRGKPYTMQGAVLVPADASTDALVRVSVARALPEALILH
jgi:hypothetical protein